MYCNFCGTKIKEGALSCPRCGAPMGHQLCTIPDEAKNKVRIMLVVSLLEFLFCNPLFGAIGLVFSILAKSALARGDVVNYKKDIKTAKYIVIAGMVLTLFCIVTYLG